MLKDSRQNEILSYLKTHHSPTIKEMAAALYVSDATIRRDLSEMQKIGLLKRSHGGAVLLESADDISIFVRMTENAKEKELAAERALPRVPDFKTIFIDSSSTALALAQRLNLEGKTIMTNNLQTAIKLSKKNGVRLMILGGDVSLTSVSVTGSWACALLQDFRFDLMIASCAALDTVYAYETSIEQRDIKRIVFDCSDRRILVADHTKFPKKAAYLFRELSAFDDVVFDELSDDQRSLFGDSRVIC